MSEQNRKPREVETRATFERPAQWRPPEQLPMPDDRPDWAHRYIRISMVGQADAKNISMRFREGYEPCKAEEYPELMVHEITEGRFKGGIEVGGLLLCRIPKEFVKQSMDYYANQNKVQMESVDNSFMRSSDPRMPLFKDRRSEVTFGKN
jgi:hypothetical protein